MSQPTAAAQGDIRSVSLPAWLRRKSSTSLPWSSSGQDGSRRVHDDSDDGDGARDVMMVMVVAWTVMVMSMMSIMKMINVGEVVVMERCGLC